MSKKSINPLIVLSVLVFLSLVVAWVLFGVLESAGWVGSEYFSFGGAAAGFIATLYLLNKWYCKMQTQEYDSIAIELEALKKAFKMRNIPKFDIPEGFDSYIDHEHSMLFCFPKKWRKEPIALQIQSIFSEEPLSLRHGDEFPGKFTVAISSPGQESFSLKEVELIASRIGISLEEIGESLGVEITDATRSLKISLEKLLSVLGIEGEDKADQIYQLNYEQIKSLTIDTPRKEIILVDRIKSLLTEGQIDIGTNEPLVQITVFTYVESSNLIYTFAFVDNLSDRNKLDLLRKQILSTVKFWKE